MDTAALLSSDSPEIRAFLTAFHDNRRKAPAADVVPAPAPTATTRAKRIAIDWQGSGMFLIDRATHQVFSIKAYGVPNRCLGSLGSITRVYRRATQTLLLPGYVDTDAYLIGAAALEAPAL